MKRIVSKRVRLANIAPLSDRGEAIINRRELNRIIRTANRIGLSGLRINRITHYKSHKRAKSQTVLAHVKPAAHAATVPNLRQPLPYICNDPSFRDVPASA
jgi:hypothetical protein